jgi:hypothetical protein
LNESPIELIGFQLRKTYVHSSNWKKYRKIFIDRPQKESVSTNDTIDDQAFLIDDPDDTVFNLKSLQHGSLIHPWQTAQRLERSKIKQILQIAQSNIPQN